jgi:outer membrane protein assembly factor BamA
MRFSLALPALAAVVLWCLPAALSAQRTSPPISFTGAPAYSQAELLSFTGLKPGASVAQQQDAAQKLNDTGLFDEVTYSGNDRGLVYTLKPASANTMLPARFANIVWWPDDQIEHLLQAHVPLYRGNSVPTSGSIRDNVAAALTAMLAEKGISNAAVGSRLSAPRPGTPPDHLVFEIDSPAVLIHSLTLQGASAEMRPKLDRVIQDLAGQQWDEAESFINIEGRVGDVYRNLGYLDIAVAKPDFPNPSVTGPQIQLDLTATLNEGAQYHVTQLLWSSSEFLSTADFNKQAKLKPGDPDSPAALRESLKSLTNAYGAKGYIDARIAAPPVIDRVAHQVSYTISVTPGPQYHLRSVRWSGLSDDQIKPLDAAWKLKPGDVYDSTYFQKFYPQTSALLRQGYKVGLLEKREASSLSVDLTISFTKGAAPSGSTLY